MQYISLSKVHSDAKAAMAGGAGGNALIRLPGFILQFHHYIWAVPPCKVEEDMFQRSYISPFLPHRLTRSGQPQLLEQVVQATILSPKMSKNQVDRIQISCVQVLIVF